MILPGKQAWQSFPKSPQQFNAPSNRPNPETPPPWLHELPAAFGQALKEIMPQTMSDLAMGIKQVGLSNVGTY